MKKLLLVLSVIVSFSCFGQTNDIENLVQIGIEHHDRGEYAKAIEAYKKALKIDPASDLVNYELALTYMYSGDNKNAIKHSDIVIKQNKEFLLLAHITKGSALSNLGKIKEALKVFDKALAKFGKNHLLYYNIGISYVKIQENKKAELAFIDAIETNPNHASSHYALAMIKNINGERVPSLLSLYYFLLLEPSSKRAETAYQLLQKQLGGNVQKDENDPLKINIVLDSKNMDSEFSTAEMMLAMLEASNTLEKNENKTPEELFESNSSSFFSVLGEIKENDKKKSNVWWDFYVPFFYDLAKSEYIEVFCNYISLSSNEKAREWIQTNKEKVDNFGKWIEEK